MEVEDSIEPEENFTGTAGEVFLQWLYELLQVSAGGALLALLWYVVILIVSWIT